MTLHKIICLSKRLIGIDINNNKYNQDIKQYINDAYSDICKYKYFSKETYTPQKLIEDEDHPVFPEKFHSCLVDYAVYRFLAAGDINPARALFFFDLYVNEASKIPKKGEEE